MTYYDQKRKLTYREKLLIDNICHNASLGLSDWAEDLLESDIFDIYDLEAMLSCALKEVSAECDWAMNRKETGNASK